ncbi:Yrdc domain containing protein mitochondrial [Fasciola gigantica]|uniref:Threonylcarbamoyl-AMP synthase n=1 Tax=Fasciola gigantica TaxID=46835 RepID=A0A504Z188_FASGI|nr:Yrdc domain containing protein mitochondrial [Fasciola gigantica]
MILSAFLIDDQIYHRFVCINVCEALQSIDISPLYFSFVVTLLALKSSAILENIVPMVPLLDKKVLSLAEATTRIGQVAQLVRMGGVIALPTDTIYGLACSVHSTSALKRIREIKGRSLNKPMAICVDKVSSIPRVCNTYGLPDDLLSALLPGPVTVVLPRLSDDPLNVDLNPNVNSLAVRVPDCGFVQKLLCALRAHRNPPLHDSDQVDSRDHPLVLTSANLSGDTSTLSVEEFRDIWHLLDVVVDGGSICSSRDSDPGGCTSWIDNCGSVLGRFTTRNIGSTHWQCVGTYCQGTRTRLWTEAGKLTFFSRLT